MIETPGFFWTVLFFLLAIGPLVFIHEMGHYLVARWCGVKADIFSIGFGREIAGWTDKRGTRWKVGWLPLGGYVRFAGDANEASEPDEAWRKLPEDERAVSLPAQTLWKRSAIVAAGPIANFLAAIAIFMGLFAAFGMQQTPAVIGDLRPGSAAERAGFERGDKIVEINGRKIDWFGDVGRYVELRPGEAMSFLVERNGEQRRILTAPDTDRTIDRFGNRSKRGLLGIASGKPVYIDVPWYRLPVAATAHVIDITRSMIDGLGQLITGKRSLQELGGPLMIAKFSGQTAAMGWITFLGFVALISINLGFINLLPIPMLDGGHLFFYAVEAVIRRPVPAQAQEWAFRSGFFALMALMVFVTINDLGSFGVWQRLSGLIG